MRYSDWSADNSGGREDASRALERRITPWAGDLRATARAGGGWVALIAFVAGLSILSMATTGCAHLGVEPWERDLLAQPQMELGSDPIDAGLDDHIYFSREASSGGRGFGGGGCGCN